jgi:hypothetical protein
MKYELKNNGRSWWVKGMIVEGEIKGRNKILEIDSIDICRLNKDIMTKEQIIECMKYPKCGFGKDYLKEIKPTFTMLEKLLLEHQLEMGYKYITRDATKNRLNFFKNKPIFNGGAWYAKGQWDFSNCFTNQLFQSIKWEDEKYYIIEDVLENCEIVED